MTPLSLNTSAPDRTTNPGPRALTRKLADRQAELRSVFGIDFVLLDPTRNELLYEPPEQPLRSWLTPFDLCAEVASRAQPEFLAEEEPIVLFALPAPVEGQESLVAAALFLLRPVQSSAELRAGAAALGLDLETLWKWAQTQSVWNAHALQQIGMLLLDKWSSQTQGRKLEHEVEQITSHLLTTYEEISLLHRLTQNLKISRGEAQLGQLALEWLADVLPTDAMAIVLASSAAAAAGGEGRAAPPVLTHGACPLETEELTGLVEYLGLTTSDGPLVLNHLADTKPDWPFPQVDSLIVVPMAEGEKSFGWLLAFNPCDGVEFGTVEASLLGSVGAILGIHSGNLDLYRQQAEFLASVVRALTSAIDAKDPYTCGHSDRVARISVRLAQELQCDEQTLQTIYLSGLLHDVGKIGIDDNVLRKPSRLTDAEYEHIKLHPELGYKILRDLKQLDQVLPVVLHHHESWDGAGYPHQLAGENIPFLARIVAVADSFDAMSSDRPYRKGMPFERLQDILIAGAGQQWDPRVVEAFLACREDICQIAHHDRQTLDGNSQQWC